MDDDLAIGFGDTGRGPDLGETIMTLALGMLTLKYRRDGQGGVLSVKWVVGQDWNSEGLGWNHWHGRKLGWSRP